MIKSLIQKQFFKNTSYYLVANCIKAVIPFIILPFLTHYLIPEEYGRWSVFSAVLSFLIPLTAFGLNNMIGRNYHTLDRVKHSEMNFMSTLIVFGISTLSFVLIVVLSLFYDDILNIPIEYYYWIPFLCVLQNFIYFYKIILRHENRALLFSILEIVNSLGLRAGGLLLVIFVSATWQSLLLSQILISIILFILILFLSIKEKKIRIKWNKTEAKQYFLMGWPMMPHAMGGIILTLSDRIILGAMTNNIQVGIYSLAANLGVAVLMFCTAFNNSWGPYLHRQMKNVTEAVKIKIVKHTYLYCLGVIFLSIALGIFCNLYILYFVSDDYAKAIDVLWWIIAGSAVYGMSLSISHYLIILGKTGVLPLITMTAAIINIFLTIVLVKYNGFVGAGQATFIAYSIYFVLLFWQSHIRYPMPWMAAIFKQKS